MEIINANLNTVATVVIRYKNSSIVCTSMPIDQITPLLIQEFERESDKYKAPA
jgi:hypothetical protein